MSKVAYLSEDADFPTKTILLALFVLAFLSYFNETLLNVALTQIMRDFSISTSWVQWSTTGFLLVMAAFAPLAANVLHWFSTRTMALWTLGIFAAGSMLCFLAPNFYFFLAARLVQALAAACSMPLLMSAILAIFPPEKRGRAMSLVAVVFTVAPALGPTLSGVIVSFWGWRYVFVATLPLVFLAMLLVFFRCRENLIEITRPPLDGRSLAYSLLGFGTLIALASHFSLWSFWQNALILLLALGFIRAFVRRQFCLATPLLNLKILHIRQFRYSMILVFVAYFLFIGLELLLPMVAQQVLWLSAAMTGLLLFPASVAEALFSPVFGYLLDKRGGRLVIALGVLVFWGALLALWASLYFAAPAWCLSVSFALFAVALAAVVAGETHGLNHLQKHDHTHGSALISTLLPLAGALGGAFLVGVMDFSGRFAGEVLPEKIMASGASWAVLAGALWLLVATWTAFNIRTEYEAPHLKSS